MTLEQMAMANLVMNAAQLVLLAVVCGVALYMLRRNLSILRQSKEILDLAKANSLHASTVMQAATEQRADGGCP